MSKYMSHYVQILSNHSNGTVLNGSREVPMLHAIRYFKYKLKSSKTQLICLERNSVTH